MSKCIFDITPEQHQILLGGLLGDGNLKKNGKTSFYYREFHAMPEKDYVLWKYNKLYNLTTKNIQYVQKRRITQNDQIGFQTRNSSSFIAYSELSIDDILNQIDTLGLLVWMLDDGCIKRNCKCRSFSLCPGILEENYVNLFINKFNNIGLQCHIIGNKKKEISFYSSSNIRIKELMYNYFDPCMDIMIKKINELAKPHHVWNKNKV